MTTPENIENLVGEKFGHLTVVEYDGKAGRGASIWKCRCDCGNLKSVRGYHLKGKKVRSCGCLRRETVNIKWPGHGGISRWLWNGYRCNANNREIDFNITPEDMWKQAQLQSMKCSLTGDKLIFPVKQGDRKNGNVSLDRIDSNFGYIPGNVQWVTKHINVSKMDYTQEKFIEMCKKVAANFP